jgi:hypothetical protein
MVTGGVGEAPARLPSALSGLLAVLVCLDVGRRSWGLRAGWIAAAVLAIDGYMIAFSRIVQYQSFVVLTGLVAVWLSVVWYQRDSQRPTLLWLAGLSLGVGTLAHYEIALALAPVVWLVWKKGRMDRWPPRMWAANVVVPLAVMAAVAALFYVPFIRHPHFSETAQYIGGRRIGGGLHNKLGDYFDRASFYNASYYVLALAAVLVAAVAATLRKAVGRFGDLAAALWLVAFALLLLRPAWFEWSGNSLAILVFLPAAVALMLSSSVPVLWQAVFSWFAVPFLVAGFMVLKPHTHFYTMMPAAALLAGWALDRGAPALEERMGARPARLLLATLAGVAAAIILTHQYVVFIRHDPEYKRVYPEARLPGYWVPFGNELPRGGYFGFPYRAGWNEVRGLYLDGTLSGNYDSNEELLITGWYTWGAVRCAESPRNYLVSWRPQDAEDIPLETIERDYPLRAVVRVNGFEKLHAYDRDVQAAEPIVLDDQGAATDVSGPASPLVERALAASQALEIPVPMIGIDTALEDGVRLLGADLPGAMPSDAGPAAPRRLYPGEAISLVLVWRADDTPSTNYSAFAHLVDASGATVAQSDGWPECGSSPTSTWRTGQLAFDGHVLATGTDLAPGAYRLLVGMYEAETGRRLAATAPSGPSGAATDAVELARFVVAGE